MVSLFDFQFGSLTSTYTQSSGAFTASVNSALTTGSVTRLEAPTGMVQFTPYYPGQPGNLWVNVGGDFSLSMTISGIGASTADGSGTFTITDTGADTITGDLAGIWYDMGLSNVFVGTLSNVVFDNNDGDGNFDGHFGSVSMSFPGSPWSGTLIELSTTSTWFDEGVNYTTDSGSVDASVFPVPTAVILGVLGVGVVGLKLRKYA